MPKNNWVQIDISDGKFTKAKTWNKPEQLKELRIKNKELRKIKFEIHLMVENPEAWTKKWLKAGANRVIVHVEGISNRRLVNGNKKIGVAIKPETPVEKLISYLNKTKIVQLLAVKPGYSGQKFNNGIVKKIKFLKKNYPKVIVEIDGGINPKTAKLVKKAGADIAVSGSYIFDSKDLRASYKNLLK